MLINGTLRNKFNRVIKIFWNVNFDSINNQTAMVNKGRVAQSSNQRVIHTVYPAFDHEKTAMMSPHHGIASLVVGCSGRKKLLRAYLCWIGKVWHNSSNNGRLPVVCRILNTRLAFREHADANTNPGELPPGLLPPVSLG
ncbi:hypothetical protein SQ11_15170 [Nitrosospira sp. NpAV]|nr:hypothetical protein SQ11_15170 [Nitrosospira sp. NpAV]